MRKTIKTLLQNRQYALVTVSQEEPSKQTLFLYQYGKKALLEGQYISPGTYLLTDETSGNELVDNKIVKQVSQNSIDAFVLPYIPYKTGSITLDDSADLVITAPLTGCTFVAEMGTSSPTLYHINKPIEREGVWMTDQKAIDEEIEELMEDKKYFTIKKNDYTVNPDVTSLATVIGFRKNETWNFYSQYLHVTETQSEPEVQIRPGKQSKLSSPSLAKVSITHTSWNEKSRLLESRNTTSAQNQGEEEKSNCCCLTQ